jgi:hypothetical protein
MASKRVEEEELDLETINSETTIVPQIPEEVEEQLPVRRGRSNKEAVINEPINCLRNERVIVRYVPKESGIVTNPKHILYGGMAENAVKYFTVPQLESGKLVNILTDDEKEFLEDIMGLEFNALSIYKKENNYWSNKQVRLLKQDNILDLSDPEQYIKYKILLANKDEIAPSLQALQDMPKATYKYVIIKEGEETSNARQEMSATMQAYMEYGKYEKDADTLRTIIETIDGRPLALNTKIEFLQTKINKLIQADAKLFLKVITDPLLSTKVLIKRAVEGGLIANRGGFFYLREDNSPLCSNKEDPTFNMAAKFLASPKNQALKFSIEAKLKAE